MAIQLRYSLPVPSLTSHLSFLICGRGMIIVPRGALAVYSRCSGNAGHPRGFGRAPQGLWVDRAQQQGEGRTESQASAYLSPEPEELLILEASPEDSPTRPW